VVDEKHIVFPDYNGNSMFNTLGNLTVNPHAGLLFIDFDTGRTLQLTGPASTDWNAARIGKFAGAERVVDFELEQSIDNPAGFPLTAKFRQFSRSNPKL
jgi:predicted pyridoxine 5'-phosphate oxidase superfamily flavin-nucleotide-binding protein